MSRRWVRVPIHESMLGFAFGGRRDAAITSDWPKDALVVGGNWDADKGMLYLTIESASFDEVLLGNVIPEWSPTFTAHVVEPPARALIDLIERMHEEELDAAAAST